MRRYAAYAAAFVIALTSSASPAQSPFPTKPIRLIVPFSPGGGGDVQGRLAAKALSDKLGQPVVVENRPGAGGNIGTVAVANSEADGYTLLLVTPATVTNPFVWAKAGYDASTNLVGVAGWSMSPMVFLAHPDVPVQDLTSLIEHAKDNPDELSYASGGIGILPHLQMALLVQSQELDMLSVPFPGQAPAVTAVAGGNVHLICDSIASGRPFVQSGRLRALAVTSPERLASLPNVPTTAEQGYPELGNTIWYGIAAPASTPADRLKILSDAVLTSLSEQENQERLAAVAAEPFEADYETFQKFMEQQGGIWAEVVKQAKIRVE